jgi:hypothetical protein
VDSSDFGLALPFRGAFNYYFIAPATEMRAARIRFGHTRNRDCIFIRGGGVANKWTPQSQQSVS